MKTVVIGQDGTAQHGYTEEVGAEIVPSNQIRKNVSQAGGYNLLPEFVKVDGWSISLYRVSVTADACRNGIHINASWRVLFGNMIPAKLVLSNCCRKCERDWRPQCSLDAILVS